MNYIEMSGRARLDILDAALSAGKIGAHIASSLSLVEISLAVLECCAEDDVFILSKGHGALGYYAAMHQLGKITDGQFASFEQDGGNFPGQTSRNLDIGIQYSGGSLGMGLSYGVGIALAHKNSAYVILGDGEINEGSVWEAAALASRLNLSNLTAVIDHNNFQSDGRCEDIMGMDIPTVWKAHGWNVEVCDGHSVEAIKNALKIRDAAIPSVVIAETMKGRGVSFMENDNAWHHNVLKKDDYEKACQEVRERYGL